MIRNFKYVFHRRPDAAKAGSVRSSWNALPSPHQVHAEDGSGVAARIRQMERLPGSAARDPFPRARPKRLETLAHTMPGSLPIGQAGPGLSVSLLALTRGKASGSDIAWFWHARGRARV